MFFKTLLILLALFAITSHTIEALEALEALETVSRFQAVGKISQFLWSVSSIASTEPDLKKFDSIYDHLIQNIDNFDEQKGGEKYQKFIDDIQREFYKDRLIDDQSCEFVEEKTIVLVHNKCTWMDFFHQSDQWPFTTGAKVDLNFVTIYNKSQCFILYKLQPCSSAEQKIDAIIRQLMQIREDYIKKFHVHFLKMDYVSLSHNDSC